MGQFQVKVKFLVWNHLFMQDEVIWVGERLKNSTYSFDKEHQILLPINNNLTEILIKSEYLKFMLCGTQMLLCSVRNKFWSLNGKIFVKRLYVPVSNFFVWNKFLLVMLGETCLLIELTSPYDSSILDATTEGPLLLKVCKAADQKL